MESNTQPKRERRVQWGLRREVVGVIGMGMEKNDGIGIEMPNTLIYAHI